MQTPNDYLRALLLELAAKEGLSDSAIARAHNRAHEDSTLAASTVQRFRDGYIDKGGVHRIPAEGTPPSDLIEQAYAAATGTTREQNWDEAIRRWRAAMKLRATRATGRSARRRSA